MCEYFLPIPIDVPSFKLIEGQTKELQGVVPNTPRAENDQKSPGRIGLKAFQSQNFVRGSLIYLMACILGFPINYQLRNWQVTDLQRK